MLDKSLPVLNKDSYFPLSNSAKLLFLMNEMGRGRRCNCVIRVLPKEGDGGWGVGGVSPSVHINLYSCHLKAEP